MDEFIEMSKYAGMREDLVQAGGGNSSFKMKKDVMFIKASGYQLADITEKKGYSIINPQIIADFFLGSDDLDKITDVDSRNILKKAFIDGERPSIETFLHAISGRYTLHTHPVIVNILACRKDGMTLLGELFPDALIVPYATPGVALAKMYFKVFRGKKVNNGIVFLQNHGLVVSGSDSAEVISRTEYITKKLEKYLHISLENYHNGTRLYQIVRNGIIWTVTDKNVLEAYHTKNGIWNTAISPDCVVYLGKAICEAGNDFDWHDLEKFCSLHGKPVVFAYRNSLYINAASVKKALEIQSVLSFCAQVMLKNPGQECNILTDEEQNYLSDWDAEKYRRNLAQGD